MTLFETCGPTETPDDIDIDALRQKYDHERTKRLRTDGAAQYLELKDEFAEFAEVDPYTPVTPRTPIDADVEVVVLGGGIAGLLAGAYLKKAGVDDVHVIEMGGDFGGVWYWNRFPGIQCDNDAYCYIPLLEELGVVPSKKFADGAEIFEHCKRIGKHFGLYDGAVFSTQVETVRWDDEISRWRLTTNRGDDIRARFVVMTQGSYNRPKLPGIPGIKDYKGHVFHSARWDYDYTGGDANGGLHKLADKRVALVGTGATGVQLVPHLGRDAKQLFVFQRTPSSVDMRGNEPTDPTWAASLQPGWQEERKLNFHRWSPFGDGVIFDAVDQVCEGLARGCPRGGLGQRVAVQEQAAGGGVGEQGQHAAGVAGLSDRSTPTFFAIQAAGRNILTYWPGNCDQNARFKWLIAARAGPNLNHIPQGVLDDA